MCRQKGLRACLACWASEFPEAQDLSQHLRNRYLRTKPLRILCLGTTLGEGGKALELYKLEVIELLIAKVGALEGSYDWPRVAHLVTHPGDLVANAAEDHKETGDEAVATERACIDELPFSACGPRGA